MRKKIYFCVDGNTFLATIGGMKCFTLLTFDETENAINEGLTPIVTTSMAHFSFDLINQGYDIYLCYRDKQVKIEPHMDLTGIGEPCKDLRFGHNIFKLFMAGIFDELIGYDRKRED